MTDHAHKGPWAALRRLWAQPTAPMLNTRIAQQIADSPFVSRDLSWLQFNCRVLQQCSSPARKKKGRPPRAQGGDAPTGQGGAE